MKKSRRDFLKLTGMAGIGLASANIVPISVSGQVNKSKSNRVKVDHAVATLDDGSVFATPFWRVDSGRDGPSLLLIAAQHGNEVQGAEVALRLQEVCAKQLVAGSVWLLPMANLPAVRKRRHSIDLGPEQPGTLSKGYNMQQTWPGNPGGNDTERVAYALDQAVLRHCSHAMDMHCWNQFYAAETLTVYDHEPSRPLGEVTTTRFISRSNARPPKGEKMMAAQLMRLRGGGAIEIELSGQFQMQERQVRMGLSSMVNIAKQLGMIEGELEKIEGPRAEHNPKTSHEVYAPCAGIFMPTTRSDKTGTLIPEDYVKEGQLLGHIIRESDLVTAPITAPISGYLWQFGMCHPLCDASLPAQHPYAEAGERIALIVTV